MFRRLSPSKFRLLLPVVVTSMLTVCGIEPTALAEEATQAPGASKQASTPDGLAEDPADTQAAASHGTWVFRQSEITGGGLVTEIAVSPWTSGHATVGGDSWGLYNTRTSGNQWLPAMKSSPGNPMTGEQGTSYYSGLAYSKNPHQKNVVYGLLGRCGGKPGEGGFIAVEGDTVLRFNPNGPKGTESHCKRQHHPRPTGNRIVVDWDATASKEYIYAAGGNGTGLWRSQNGGADWVNIGLAKKNEKPVITGMALVPGDNDSIVVTTRTSTIYVVSNIRSAATGDAKVQTVDLGKTLAGLQFEEVTDIGGTLYAAARSHGIYTSKDGIHWSPTRGTIPSTVNVVTVGGNSSGSLVFAGCVADKATPHCIYRTKDGGGSWAPVADNPDFTEWGSNQKWWHSNLASAMINGHSYVTSQIAVDKNGTTVYVAGRAGVWKSEHSGDSWRPAVVGLGGTMHHFVEWDGTFIETDDVDFYCEKSTPADRFLVSSGIQNPPKGGCPAIDAGPTKSLTTTFNNGATTVTVVPPSADGTPSKFLVNGKDEATDWFRAQVIRPSDVLFHDGTLYIAQFGGGLVVGHQKQ
ncbi:hypothetical protein [Vitiosangium sp. GDMCC 1.1324]|uniref:WD40/YVTN/BNR-like repeat-containing protein n=1 Tax=Vitiosangium sp. (strain GDMCC 1.1324) TaxID=2138576 RepID=UPI000D368477|nr:hypothetical protein [Vitiosangium sp. GDMCC 1.1324]PTL84800.1 hypothetical protein DAT35_07000 [Vitiosangium sp. GDMCC 1.1324]